jgi:hypothetical protein
VASIERGTRHRCTVQQGRNQGFDNLIQLKSQGSPEAGNDSKEVDSREVDSKKERISSDFGSHA